MAGPRRVCIPSLGPADWKARLADPDRHWRAGHPAVATAQSWAAGFPPEVATLCGPEAELQLAVVEHAVPMPGRGSPSHSDIFALAHAGGRDIAVAIEAKVAEPFGPADGIILRLDWARGDPRHLTDCSAGDMA